MSLTTAGIDHMFPHIVATLLSSHSDVVNNEIVKFMDHGDRYRMCFGFFQQEVHNKKQGITALSPVILTLLDHFGFELFKSRSCRVYRKAASYLSTMKKLTFQKSRTKTWWIYNASDHKQMMEWYRLLAFDIFEILDDHQEDRMTTFQNVKLKILNKFQGHFVVHSEQPSLFELYYQFLKLEIEHLRNNYWKFSAPSNSSEDYDIGVELISLLTLELKIDVYGQKQCGKREMLRSYFTNVFGGENDFELTQHGNIMIDGLVVQVSVSAVSMTELNILTKKNVDSQPTRQKDHLEVVNQNKDEPDAIIFVHDSTRLFTTSTSKTYSLREQELQHELFPSLRKLVLSHPFTPIVVAYSKFDLIDHLSWDGSPHTALEQALHEFPHVVALTSFSSLTQAGLLQCFNQAYRSAINARYGCCYQKEKKCDIQ
ncbi:hypothetical protein C9374_012834 [Naegleria lovaniensis]|uniref:Uncharacterized protein n=1 Tax=Naegleria lovaniensis TaxID=51637 RepID=A0AA88KHQ4_NAELO|nr:uncharacterized protein C9374_012834 [Naegleria lovaniensis]KAG2373102.1 hypothetical protein C9374_012834 [Naegleria lovaniensis]